MAVVGSRSAKRTHRQFTKLRGSVRCGTLCTAHSVRWAPAGTCGRTAGPIARVSRFDFLSGNTAPTDCGACNCAQARAACTMHDTIILWPHTVRTRSGASQSDAAARSGAQEPLAKVGAAYASTAPYDRH